MARNESVSFWDNPEDDEDKVEDSASVKKPRTSFGEYFASQKGFLDRLVNPESEDDDNDDEKSKKKKQKKVGSSIFKSLSTEEEVQDKKTAIEQAQEKVADVYEAKDNLSLSGEGLVIRKITDNEESFDIIPNTEEAYDSQEPDSAEDVASIIENDNLPEALEVLEPENINEQAEFNPENINEKHEILAEIPEEPSAEVIRPEEDIEDVPKITAPPVAPPIIIREFNNQSESVYSMPEDSNSYSLKSSIPEQFSRPNLPEDNSSARESKNNTIEKKSAVGALFTFIGAEALSRRRDKKLEKKISKVEDNIPSDSKIEQISKEVTDIRSANFRRPESVSQILQKEKTKYSKQITNESKELTAIAITEPNPEAKAKTDKYQLEDITSRERVTVGEVIPPIFAGAKQKESVSAEKSSSFEHIKSAADKKPEKYEVYTSAQEVKNETFGSDDKSKKPDKLAPGYFMPNNLSHSTNGSSSNIVENTTIKTTSEVSHEFISILDDPKKSVTTGFITAIVILVIYIIFYIFG